MVGPPDAMTASHSTRGIYVGARAPPAQLGWHGRALPRVQDESEACSQAAAALLAMWTDPKVLGARTALAFDAWELLLRTGTNPAALSASQAALQLAKVGGVWESCGQERSAAGAEQLALHTASIIARCWWISPLTPGSCSSAPAPPMQPCQPCRRPCSFLRCGGRPCFTRSAACIAAQPVHCGMHSHERPTAAS